MESLLYTGWYIFILEIYDTEIWLEEAGIPATGLASTEIWFCKAFKHGGMGRLKQSLAEKSSSPSPFSSLPAFFPPSLLPVYAYQRHSWWQCLGNASSL